MTETESPPEGVASRVEAERPIGRLDTTTAGALIDGDDIDGGHVDVGPRAGYGTVGLVTVVESDVGIISTNVELSPSAARELATALNQQADTAEKFEGDE